MVDSGSNGKVGEHRHVEDSSEKIEKGGSSKESKRSPATHAVGDKSAGCRPHGIQPGEKNKLSTRTHIAEKAGFSGGPKPTMYTSSNTL